jgi:hypothetical protein
MRFTVIYNTPKHKKKQKATFFRIEDCFLWENHIKENLNATDVKIVPS